MNRIPSYTWVLPHLALLLCAVLLHGSVSQGTPLGDAPPDTLATVSERVEHPATAPDSVFLPVDSTLQAKLDQATRDHPSWVQLADDERLALGIVDFSDLDRPRYAAINGSEMLYAASLPKIGILLAAVHQLEEGTLSMSPAIERDLNAMIRVSSNAAATRMIDRVGGLEAVNEVLTHPQYQFYDAAKGGGLWVGKRYASDDQRNPDPIEGLSHAANVYQVCRFYTLLAQHRLINEARSEQMLEILDDPGLSHKFVGPLEERAPQAEIHRKSGSWRHWHADSALVWGPERQYVVVALVQYQGGGRVIQSVIPVVERVLGIEEDPSASAS